MLKIYLGNMEKAIYHPPTYFEINMRMNGLQKNYQSG